VDEQMLLLNVRDRGFLDLAGPLWLDQSAPLGWLALERLLLTLGPSEPAVRLLSTAFGVATLVTAWWIARRWMTALAGTAFVLLCAFGEWIVFFTLELKHYSADMFGSLVVPAAAAWAIEGAGDRAFGRRIMIWWTVAALLQWFSNGALFTTPLCAVVLVIQIARRDRRAWTAAVIGAAVWLASFAANDALVLRHAAANAYLRNYWEFAFPPVSDGAAATLAWILKQLAPFARKPGGSGWPLLFWTSWMVGVSYAVVRKRTHGIAIATVPIAAFGLAVLHIVPPFERLAMWVVPSVYVGIAYSLDAAVALLAASGKPRAIRAAASAVVAFVALLVCSDIVRLGGRALTHRPRSNYGLDDRSAVRTLLANHRAGDAVMTTHFGLAALWWYGGIRIDGNDRGGHLPDGSPIFELHYVSADGGCRHHKDRLAAVVADYPRAAVYLGFRMNVEPPGFDTFVLDEMRRRGTLDAYKAYAEQSRVAVFDLKNRPAELAIVPSEQPEDAPPLAGCLSVGPAARW
jgi:hypothetical protein